MDGCLKMLCTKESLNEQKKMMESFFPILDHFCPLFIQIAQMGLRLILSRWEHWGLILHRIPPPTLFFTQQSHTPFGNRYTHKAPPTPLQNTHFLGLNFKVGTMNYHLGKMRPIWGLLGNLYKKQTKLFQKWAKSFIHQKKTKLILDVVDT